MKYAYEFAWFKGICPQYSYLRCLAGQRERFGADQVFARGEAEVSAYHAFEVVFQRWIQQFYSSVPIVSCSVSRVYI